MRHKTIALAAVLTACGGTPLDPPPAETARVRLMHTAHQAPALDLLVGGQVVAQGVSVDQASPFADAPAGSQTVALRATGSAATLTSFSAAFAAGTGYTVRVTGSAAALSSSVVVDTGATRSDRANLRIVNIPEIRTGPDSSSERPAIPVDVYITSPEVSLDRALPQMSLDQNRHSYSPLIYLDPATWQVRFTTAGTRTVLAATAAVPIAAGQVRAVTLYRTEGGGWAVSVLAEP